MKHIEVSRKIHLSRAVEPALLKDALLNRLQGAMEIETVSDGEEHFKLVGTTGSPSSMTRHAQVEMDVDMTLDGNTARIILSGVTRPAYSLTILYTVLFLFFLFIGLLPGFIETSADKSDAVDALVFLIFGIYIVTDVNKKTSEPRELIEAALDSLDTTFG
ncbi:MAG: hypothetical protein KDJ15_05265 [Alphaproteobacteria bacterium]|nr:hypothetical protein [Alphaproteobacteria bacterium]